MKVVEIGSASCLVIFFVISGDIKSCEASVSCCAQKGWLVQRLQVAHGRVQAPLVSGLALCHGASA